MNSMTTSKKSFDFRMSKKVAELTQVVHMLFTRNHEKEIETEALKDAYEDEIDAVIKDAKSKIADLEKQLSNLKSMTTTNDNAWKETERIKNSLKDKENLWSKRITALELELKNEKLECQKVRDLLIEAQKDMERLRESQTLRATNKIDETEVVMREIETLKAQNRKLQKELENLPSLEVHTQLQKTLERTSKELAEMKTTFLNSEKTKQQLTVRNKLLEEQVKELKKEISRKSERQTALNGQDGDNTISRSSVIDYTTEINRLQSEIKRYRMELYNREGNFNRMFTAKSPVIIDRKTGKFADGRNNFNIPHMRYSKQNRDGSMMSQTDNITMHVNLNVNGGRPPSQSSLRHTIDAADMSMVQDIPELPTTCFRSPSASSRVSSATLFPQFGLDARRRLSKPKPIPREMISTKAGVR